MQATSKELIARAVRRVIAGKFPPDREPGLLPPPPFNGGPLDEPPPAYLSQPDGVGLCEFILATGR